jgi:hypothetical protein
MRCDARWPECEPRAVGEAIQRTRESRRNSNCGWTQTRDALNYLVRESIDHVVAEPKRKLEAGEGCVMVGLERTLNLKTGIVCLLSLLMPADEPPLCSCHVPDLAASVPFL